jgi:hypothetical protein
MKNAMYTIICLGLLGGVIFGLLYLLSIIFNWIPSYSPSLLLDIAAGAVCLIWLLFVLKVPWDLFFETRSILFEMQRSIEKQLAVNPDRIRYVNRMQRITGAIAISSHIVSATIITGLTYWSNGKVGYFFAFFYIVATFFRPAKRAYDFLIIKLREIRNEVKYPREDVIKLRQDLSTLEEQIKILKESQLCQLEERMTRLSGRVEATEESDRGLKADISNSRSMIERVERSFQSRIECLSEEVERTLTKAIDNQDVITGVRAFARLIKQA